MSKTNRSEYAQTTKTTAVSIAHPTFGNGRHNRSRHFLDRAMLNLLISVAFALLAAAIGATYLLAETASALPLASKHQQVNNLAIGSSVFLDVNDDGIFGADEPGIRNISLTVYNAFNTLVATATTDIDGTYLITGLAEGNYYIIIQSPPQNAPTSSNVTNLNDDQIDDDDNGDQPGGPGAPVISPIIRLVAGDEPTNESGLGGDADDLSDDSGDMTIDFGFVPTDFSVSVGNFVWDDLNQDGLQDADEEGLPGVTLNIFNANTGLPLVDEDGEPITTVTDSTGQYQFENLPPGNYYLTLSDIPVGYQATLQNVGSNDSLDSDLYLNVSQTTPTGPLVDGVQYTALDAGYFDEEAGFIADIGDKVWYDYDGDGIQGTDPNEYGLGDISVTLYEGINRTIVQSVTTDEDGNYAFTRIPAGNYYLVFASLNNFLIPVWPGRSPNESVDSDISMNGQTAQFTLTGGEDISSMDAGFVLPAELEVNFWNDLNQDGIRNAGETGFRGSQVILLSESNERLSDVLTDNNGVGVFQIPPGTYRLQFVPPGGFAISEPSTAGEINSDADENGLTPTLTVLPNETTSGWGAGAYEILPSSLTEENEPAETEDIFGESGHSNLQMWIYLPLVD